MGKKNEEVEVIQAIFNAWRQHQRRPSICKLTPERIELIESRIALGYDKSDFISLFNYAWNSDEAGPRFWRGDNDRNRTYLGLDNLLRKNKLGTRIEKALNWEECLTVEDDDNFIGFTGIRT